MNPEKVLSAEKSVTGDTIKSQSGEYGVLDLMEAQTIGADAWKRPADFVYMTHQIRVVRVETPRHFGWTFRIDTEGEEIAAGLTAPTCFDSRQQALVEGAAFAGSCAAKDILEKVTQSSFPVTVPTVFDAEFMNVGVALRQDAHGAWSYDLCDGGDPQNVIESSAIQFDSRERAMTDAGFVIGYNYCEARRKITDEIEEVELAQAVAMNVVDEGVDARNAAQNIRIPGDFQQIVSTFAGRGLRSRPGEADD